MTSYVPAASSSSCHLLLCVLNKSPATHYVGNILDLVLTRAAPALRRLATLSISSIIFCCRNSLSRPTPTTTSSSLQLLAAAFVPFLPFLLPLQSCHPVFHLKHLLSVLQQWKSLPTPFSLHSTFNQVCTQLTSFTMPMWCTMQQHRIITPIPSHIVVFYQSSPLRFATFSS